MILLKRFSNLNAATEKVWNIEKGNNEKKFSYKYLYSLDMLYCKLRYKISSQEYIALDVFKLGKTEKKKIYTIHDREKIVKNFNDLENIYKVEMKHEFLKNFKCFIGRSFMSLENSSFLEFKDFFIKHPKIIAKHSDGFQGRNIKTYVLSEEQHYLEKVFNEILSLKFDIIEEFVTPHPDFDEISTMGLPAIRVFTFLNDFGEVEIISTSMAISIQDEIVNICRGAIILELNVENGMVTSSGIDTEGNIYERHPVTKKIFKGFRVPYWEELIQMMKVAGKVMPNIRYIGWDVSVGEKQPLIIEANAINPGTLQYQFPIFKYRHKIRNRMDEILASIK